MMAVMKSLCLTLWFERASCFPPDPALFIKSDSMVIMDEKLEYEYKKENKVDQHMVKYQMCKVDVMNIMVKMKKVNMKYNRKEVKGMNQKDEDNEFKKIEGKKIKKEKNNSIKKEEGHECTTCGKVYTAVSKLYRHLSLSHFRTLIQKLFCESFDRKKVLNFAFILYNFYFISVNSVTKNSTANRVCLCI